MSAENTRYSLWVRPPAEVADRLQALISQLADTYNAPHFSPHMTLVANVLTDQANTAALQARVQALSQKLGTFSITLKQFGYLEEEHRCLFLLAESPELTRVYEQTAVLFPEVAAEHFAAMPHFSMLYGHYDQAAKENMIADNPAPELTFEAAAIDLVASGGPAETWKTVFSVEL